MCFDASTSGLACITAFLSAYYLYKRNSDKNDRFIAVLTLMFGLIQFNEFCLWLNPVRGRWNHFFTITIFFLFFLFSLVTNAVFYHLYRTVIEFKYFYVFFAIYLFITVFLMERFNRRQICSLPKKDCRIKWEPVSEYVKELNKFYHTPLIYSLNGKFLLFTAFNVCFVLSILLLFFNIVVTKNKMFFEHPYRYGYLVIVYILSCWHLVVTQDGFFHTLRNQGLFLTPSKLFQMSGTTPSQVLERFDMVGSFASFAACFVGLVAIFD
jgi:hypothetical protein